MKTVALLIVDKYKTNLVFTITVLLFPSNAFFSNLVSTESRYGTLKEKSVTHLFNNRINLICIQEKLYYCIIML